MDRLLGGDGLDRLFGGEGRDECEKSGREFRLECEKP